MESPAVSLTTPRVAADNRNSLPFSASERSAVRRLSFLTLAVHLASAVAFLVRTKFQRAFPDCDI